MPHSRYYKSAYFIALAIAGKEQLQQLKLMVTVLGLSNNLNNKPLQACGQGNAHINNTLPSDRKMHECIQLVHKHGPQQKTNKGGNMTKLTNAEKVPTVYQ